MGKYLEHIKMDAFGAFSNRLIGPFGPGMNVVFGRNEAGKTTFAQFVGGVLFGWEEARGQRNTYKPDNAERAGTLFFANEDGSGDSRASRIRNADGLQGDTSVADDIDRETYRTMFSLTSDELRQLRNTTDVTAKLLTAGSGTGASPAHALTALQELSLIHIFVLITHYPEDIIPEIKRLVMVKEGKLFADGAKEDMLTDQMMSSLFDVPLQVAKNGKNNEYFSLVSSY